MNRRRFLFLSGGAIAFAAPSDQITLGLIGAGGRGNLRHADLSEGPVPTSRRHLRCYEPNLERALSAAKKGSTQSSIGTTKNCSPTKTSRPSSSPARALAPQMVLDALAAGKDVYVEKPLCQTPEQGVRTGGGGRNRSRLSRSACSAAAMTCSTKARQIVRRPDSGQRANGPSLVAEQLTRSGRPTGQAGRHPLDWEQWQGPLQKRDP